jgi:hypothetical protein
MKNLFVKETEIETNETCVCISSHAHINFFNFSLNHTYMSYWHVIIGKKLPAGTESTF